MRFGTDTSALQQRLWQLATRPRPVNALEGILVPATLCPLAPEALFPCAVRQRALELGCGWGEYAVECLRADPDLSWVAFEIKSDRLRSAIRRARRAGVLDRLRLIPVNFGWFLEQILPPRSFDRLIVNFPDPWPKRRHRKHRLIQPGFPLRVSELLRPGAMVELATDHGPYARQMLRVFRATPDFRNILPRPGFQRERPPGAPATRFEQLTRMEKEHAAYYLRFQFRPPKNAEKELADTRAAHK